jgi:hypothetical protein
MSVVLLINTVKKIQQKRLLFFSNKSNIYSERDARDGADMLASADRLFDSRVLK